MSNVTDDLLTKIKANQPEILTEDNDYLGTIPKGDMIKGFLDSLLQRPIEKDKNEEIIPDIQMLALYGEWGSGKTSLMKYIKEKIDKETNFKTVFFPAWEMEKDENLSLSLLESIIESEDGVDKTDIKEAFLAIGMGICKALSAKIGPLNINFKEVMQSVEEYNKSITDDSALKRIKKFKEEYSKLEKLILEKTKCEKLVAFIDDLDRCEPENVLNLLSAIKLFFTFGNRIIFICGLDEKAVDEAVKVKYREVVKSGEYMEKIFDISFDMPKLNINKMITHYFDDIPEAVDGVQKFFEAMHFTNPRRVKKVLNKYLLVRYYQKSGLDGDGLIPDQNIEFFRYLTLFIIILYKFEPDNFEMLRDYDAKLVYLRNHKDEDYVKTVNRWKENEYALDRANTYTFGNMVKILKDQRMHIISCLAVLFGNKIDNYRVYDYGKNGAEYIDQFLKQSTKNGAFVKYCGECFNMFLKSEIIPIKNSQKGTCVVTLSDIGENLSGNNYVLWNIFDMAEHYL